MTKPKPTAATAAPTPTPAPTPAPSTAEPAAPAVDTAPAATATSAPEPSTATREAGTAHGGTSERATATDSAAEQRETAAPAEAEDPTKLHANGSMFGPTEHGVASADEQTAVTIAALKRERSGYVARGLFDRVKAVDGELKRLGHKS